jgi:hypothetical protein
MQALNPRGSKATVHVSDEKAERLLAWGWTVAGQQADVSGDDGPPPKVGRGSSRDAWAEYATSQGVEVTDDMTRAEIIEAVEG